MTDQFQALVDDLAAEHAALSGLLTSLTEHQWDEPTPSPGWTVSHQVAHLGYFDEAARCSIAEPDRFVGERDALISALMESGAQGMDALTLEWIRAIPVAQRAEAWRTRAAACIAAARGCDPSSRLEWYGPSMSPKSFVGARLMETWAHGHDIADAVGAVVVPTMRLRHIATLGVLTRGWSYLNRGREANTEPVFVELRAPDDSVVAFGDPLAPSSIRGSLYEFCLVVTQRRHVSETGIEATEGAASEWMELAQAFAGGPTQRPPTGEN